MTVYKMHGMANDYLAAVDEDNGRIWRLDDNNEMHPPIAELEREDVTDCSSWDLFLDDHDGFDWPRLLDQVVFESGHAEILERWYNMDI